MKIEPVSIGGLYLMLIPVVIPIALESVVYRGYNNNG